jgi:hypothetical protein
MPGVGDYDQAPPSMPGVGDYDQAPPTTAPSMLDFDSLTIVKPLYQVLARTNTADTVPLPPNMTVTSLTVPAHTTVTLTDANKTSEILVNTSGTTRTMPVTKHLVPPLIYASATSYAS